VYAHLPT